jgi:hypothetical protein
MRKKKYSWKDIKLYQFELITREYVEFEKKRDEIIKSHKINFKKGKTGLAAFEGEDEIILNDEENIELAGYESSLFQNIVKIIGINEKDVTKVNLDFLNEPIDDISPKNEVVIDGEKYFIADYDNFKFGEYADMMYVMKAAPFAYANILAIVLRKAGEEYDDRFKIEKLRDREKIFKNVSVEELLPLINFIKALLIKQEIYTRVYSLMKVQSSQAMLGRTLQKDGIGKALFILLHPKIYLKSKLLDRLISITF